MLLIPVLGLLVAIRSDNKGAQLWENELTPDGRRESMRTALQQAIRACCVQKIAESCGVGRFDINPHGGSTWSAELTPSDAVGLQCYGHRWKAGIPSFPTVPITFQSDAI